MKEVMKCAIESMPVELYDALVAKPILSIDVQREWINQELGLNIPLDILQDIEKAVNNQPFFAKFSTRSPKDFLTGLQNKIVAIKNIEDFALIFSEFGSMRILEDIEELYQDKELKYKIHILPWIEIAPQSEWRCYVRNGKLIAISQYFYNIGFNNFAPNKNDIVAFASQYLSYLPIKDIVMDIVYGKGLLELNPYGKSDPCLFTYAELDAMDGSEVAFRYNAVDKVSE